MASVVNGEVGPPEEDMALTAAWTGSHTPRYLPTACLRENITGSLVNGRSETSPRLQLADVSLELTGDNSVLSEVFGDEGH